MGLPLPVVEPTLSETRPSFEDVYRDYYHFVWRNARRLGCSDDWAEDAAHEVFLIVNRRLAEFEGRSSVRTWLFSITYRVVHRLRRNRARYARGLDEYARTPRLVARPHERADAQQTLMRLLAQLDERRRLVFILVELEGMTMEEVAGCLGIPTGTVGSRLRKARQHLTAMIEREARKGSDDDVNR